MEEMSAHLKLEQSPLIKCLLFSDKKPNTHYMVLAGINTKPEKGNFGGMQLTGRRWVQLITMLG